MCTNIDTNKTEFKVFYEYLLDKRVTCSQASVELGIYQKNLTRYKRKLELSDRLWVVNIGRCPETGLDAQFITTNPDFKPKSHQISLF